LSLAKEYRKLGGTKNQAQSLQYLEIAFNVNQNNVEQPSKTTSNEQLSNNTNNEVILQYYQEMGQVLLTEDKTNQAIDCYRKSLDIAKKMYGPESFNTMECYLNLAQLLEKKGQKDEAEDLFNECLENFDKKDAEMKKNMNDITDFNSINSSQDISEKLFKQ